MNWEDTHIDLLTGFRNGNEDAVRELYLQFYRPLCYYAGQLVNESSEAEDIAVDTFLKLLKKREDFDKVNDIRSFLYTTTRNACFDYLRKIKVENKYKAELTFTAVIYEQFGDREMITAKVLEIIYAEVEKLPSQCRQVFKSIYMECKTTAAIAEEMGLSPQTVLNQKTKALQALRLILYKNELFSAGLFIHCLFLITSKGSS